MLLQHGDGVLNVSSRLIAVLRALESVRGREEFLEREDAIVLAHGRRWLRATTKRQCTGAILRGL